jgi:hypothetical protein
MSRGAITTIIAIIIVIAIVGVIDRITLFGDGEG